MATEQLFPDKIVISLAESNKQAILDVLLNKIIPDSLPISILEIASGTGQHIVHFAAYFPLATFQPSDIDSKYLKSIRAYIDEYDVNAFTKNIRSPIEINVLFDNKDKLEDESYDFIYSSNLIHISSIECIEGLFRLSTRILKSNGSLITYGPYALQDDGRITPESNRHFHDYLQFENPGWGLRAIDDLIKIAEENRMELKEIIDMPMNSKILWWTKTL